MSISKRDFLALGAAAGASFTLPAWAQAKPLIASINMFVPAAPGGGWDGTARAMERAAKRGYATATDLADYLVKKGLPFRDAHEVVAHAVKTAQGLGVDLSELPLETLQKFDSRIEADVFGPLSLQGSLNARNTLGGTAPAQVRIQIARHRQRLV